MGRIWGETNKIALKIDDFGVFFADFDSMFFSGNDTKTHGMKEKTDELSLIMHYAL